MFKARRILLMGAALPAVGVFLWSAAGADSQVFHIPRLEGIVIDGASADWASRGFRVDYLTGTDGQTVPADDFDVKFRLGWNADGLLLLAAVRDDIPEEHAELREMWEKDCLEVFLSEEVGSENRFQLVIASGADPAFRTVRTHFFDWRPQGRRATSLKARASSLVGEGGSVVEALLPWENLGIHPRSGKDLGIQVIANDADSIRLGWYPAFDPSHPGLLHRIRLDDAPSEPVLFRVDREIVRGACMLSLRGSDELIGLKVEVRSGKEVLVSGTMLSAEGRSGFTFHVPAPTGRDAWPPLEVRLGGKSVSSFASLPPLERILERHRSALGGDDALEKIRTRRLSGNLIHEYPRQDPPKTVLPAEILAAFPDEWLLSLKTSRGLFQMGSDGTRGWTQDADRILIDNRQVRSRLAYLFLPQGVLRLEEFFGRLALLDRTDAGGRPAYIVGATSPDGVRRRLHFDAESGLLTRIDDDLQVRDYREQEGVLHPCLIVINRRGGTSTYAFDNIEVNVCLEAGRFAVPDMSRAFPQAFQGLPESRIVPLLKNFPSTHEEMSIPCRDGRFLYDFIVRNGYKRGLEIGTFTGYSALWMGMAFEKTGGKLITIECDPASGGKARENIVKSGLESVVDSRIADAFAEIPIIEDDFDFVFIDAWKPDYIKFLRLVRNRLLPGGAIVAHNVTNYARDMKDYLEAVRTDPGLETTFQEISGEGMSVSVRRR